MGAETTIYCLVVKERSEWVEIQAVTLEEAAREATKLDGVVRVLDVSYAPRGYSYD